MPGPPTIFTPMNEIPLPSIILTKDGFFRLPGPLVKLGNQDDILKSVAATIPSTIPNAFEATIRPGVKAQVGVQIKGSDFICWCKLPSLRLSTVFNLMPDGAVYPIFKKAPTPDTQELNHTEEWDPSLASAQMFLVVVLNHDKKQYLTVNACLGLRADGEKILRRPPLPNIHSDGMVCLGGAPSPAPTLLGAFEQASNHFHSSRWNTDLLSNLTIDTITGLYSWKGGKQQPIPAGLKWSALPQCYAINNIYTADLPLG